MRSNERLQRVMALRQFGGKNASVACAVEPASTFASDLRLFVLTFAGGFLFTSIFIA